MQLQTAGDDGGFEHCIHCGALAVGPCASCHGPVCGDCCVLTEGGSRVYAVCTRCAARRGRSLRHGWLTVLGWLGAPIALLAIAVAILYGLAWWSSR